MDLLRAVQTIRPLYHVFGHMHEGYGMTEDGIGTVYVNARCPSAHLPAKTPNCTGRFKVSFQILEFSFQIRFKFSSCMGKLPDRGNSLVQIDVWGVA